MKIFLLVLLSVIFNKVYSYNKEIYIVSFKTPPLAANKEVYTNKRLAATQLEAIKTQHQHLLTQFNNHFNTTNKILYDYKIAINAISLTLSSSEAEYISNQENVLKVTKQEFLHVSTDATAHMVKADMVWSGAAIAPLAGVKGEDIIVGIIDTGINITHESFSDLPEDGYSFTAHNPNGADIFIGWCDPLNPSYDPTLTCNNKLIGAWDYVDIFGNENDGPLDGNFHGTHESGIISGNYISAPVGGFVYSFNGGILDAPSISGIAPHSHIIMYDVCDNTIGCPSSAILAAIDQAISDGVNIINLALDGGKQPWEANSVALALLNANNLGIITSTAAGNASNSNPPVSYITEGAVNNLAPWVITAANSLHGRTVSNDISLIDPIPIPGFLMEMYSLLTDGVTLISDLQAQIIYAENIDNSNGNGCSNWGLNDFLGTIALIQSGNCSNEIKVQNAEDAGAIAVIVYQTDSDIPQLMTSVTSPTIPSTIIGKTDGENIINFINNTNPMITMVEILAETKYKIVNALGNVLFCSSLRGPNTSFDVSKPDLAAPGRDIFAAIAELGQPSPQYFTGTGTSQSAAVISGALALLKNIHPSWSPSELKSSLMLNANKSIIFGPSCSLGPSLPIGLTTTDDTGSGMLNIANAANSVLVLNETTINYMNANPEIGGIPSTLNLASMRNNQCNNTCNWARTLTNKGSTTRSWSVTTKTDGEFELNVSETNFTLNPDESIKLSIAFELLSGNRNLNKYGLVFLTDNSNETPQATLSVVVDFTEFLFSNGFE